MMSGRVFGRQNFVICICMDPGLGFMSPTHLSKRKKKNKQSSSTWLLFWVAANMLHFARASMLVSSQLRKKNSLQAYAELEKAPKCLDSSIGIFRVLLGNPKLDSLDLLGLLEITRRDYLNSKEKKAITGNFDHTLRQFIDIFKQPNIWQFMMSHSDAKAKYLSCLKRLVNDSNEIGMVYVLKELCEKSF